MSGLRIDNCTDDGITVFLDGNKLVIYDEEKENVQNVEKGLHTLRVHRTRVPLETVNENEVDKSDLKAMTDSNDKSVHTQLDGIFEFEVNSSKAVVTVSTSINGVEKFGTDAIFSGYKIQLTGAKLKSERSCFASSDVKKRFVKHQLKNAFFPIGIGGIIIFLVGLWAVYSNVSGGAPNLGGRRITLPWSIVIAAIGLAFIFYMVYVLIRIEMNVKKYKN